MRLMFSSSMRAARSACAAATESVMPASVGHLPLVHHDSGSGSSLLREICPTSGARSTRHVLCVCCLTVMPLNIVTVANHSRMPNRRLSRLPSGETVPHPKGYLNAPVPGVSLGHCLFPRLDEVIDYTLAVRWDPERPLSQLLMSDSGCAVIFLPGGAQLHGPNRRAKAWTVSGQS